MGTTPKRTLYLEIVKVIIDQRLRPDDIFQRFNVFNVSKEFVLEHFSTYKHLPCKHGSLLPNFYYRSRVERLQCFQHFENMRPTCKILDWYKGSNRLYWLNMTTVNWFISLLHKTRHAFDLPVKLTNLNIKLRLKACLKTFRSRLDLAVLLFARLSKTNGCKMIEQ